MRWVKIIIWLTQLQPLCNRTSTETLLNSSNAFTALAKDINGNAFALGSALTKSWPPWAPVSIWTGLKWCHLRLILLVVGLINSSHGLNFVHSGVEALDVLWRVETRGVVVLVGHNFGAKTRKRQGAPVVGRAYGFHLLQNCEEPSNRWWVHVSDFCERTGTLSESCITS